MTLPYHTKLPKNVYLLLAHPDKNSFNGHLAHAYENALRAKGHNVRRQDLGDMKFDPVLWKGYTQVQELEPDLQQAQENIKWCDHWVIIYPVWWGSVPALLKGFIDRTMLPGFGFKYHENDPFWDKYLRNRSAHLITTSDAPALWLWWQYRNSDIRTMKTATLEFCGIRPVKTTRIGRIKYMHEQQRTRIIQNIVRGI
jgi:putative NADPH-quinone reductase